MNFPLCQTALVSRRLMKGLSNFPLADLSLYQSVEMEAPRRAPVHFEAAGPSSSTTEFSADLSLPPLAQLLLGKQNDLWSRTIISCLFIFRVILFFFLLFFLFALPLWRGLKKNPAEKTSPLRLDP